MFLTAFIVLLSVTGSELLDSLKKQPFIELSVQGTYPRSLEFPTMSVLGFVETPDDSLWIFAGNNVYILDRTRLKWRLVGKFNYDDHKVVSGYDPYHKNFLFWSESVGRVYTWKPDEPALTRIDKSDHHKTQFGHVAFVEPTTGNIYAFGGGGFWQARSYITKFDHEIKEWSIVPINDSSQYPSERMGARGAYDEQKNQLHIFGGYGYEKARADLSHNVLNFSDYWVFDLNSGNWRQKKIYNEPDSIKSYGGAYQHYSAGMNSIDKENRLIWYFVNTNKVGTLQLFVFDLDRDFGVYLPVFIPIDNHLNHYEYDKTQNRLLIYYINRFKKSDDKPLIRLMAFNLPSAENTRVMMDMFRSNEQLDTTQLSSTHLIVLSSISILLILSWLFYKRKKKAPNNPDKSIELNSVEDESHKLTTSTSNLVRLEIKFRGDVTITINGTSITHAFSKPELEIFLWLFWKKNIGKAYQSTDVIEEVFWSDVQNQDYIRKQRNICLRRLNSQLCDIFDAYIKRDDWIIDRNAYNDKRKKEYALNLDDVIVINDLDVNGFEIDEILSGLTSKWADQIRSEYRVWTAA